MVPVAVAVAAGVVLDRGAGDEREARPRRDGAGPAGDGGGQQGIGAGAGAVHERAAGHAVGEHLALPADPHQRAAAQGRQPQQRRSTGGAVAGDDERADLPGRSPAGGAHGRGEVAAVLVAGAAVVVRAPAVPHHPAGAHPDRRDRQPGARVLRARHRPPRQHRPGGRGQLRLPPRRWCGAGRSGVDRGGGPCRRDQQPQGGSDHRRPRRDGPPHGDILACPARRRATPSRAAPAQLSSVSPTQPPRSAPGSTATTVEPTGVVQVLSRSSSSSRRCIGTNCLSTSAWNDTKTRPASPSSS